MNVICCECAFCFEAEAASMVRCPRCKEYDKPEAPKKDSPEGWRVDCERAVFNASVLLRLAKITGGTMAAVVEMIRTAPRSRKDMNNTAQTALFFRIALEAERLSGSDELFGSAMSYFRELAEMAPERRRMLEASVAGILMGFMMA